ncbi:carboxypeptidase-like regulatory domain-containing protein [Candidatus Latescibacterota bacterium]
MVHRLIVLLLICCSFQSAHAQESFTISGYIRDAATGEELVGASCYVPELKAGGMANGYGFYSLTVPAGSYVIRYGYIGYEQLEVTVDITAAVKKDVELTEKTIVIQEVVVSGKTNKDTNVTSTETGTVQITPKDVATLPILFGEPDVLKSIQLLPGIAATNEGNSGFNVRGGSPGQNLILLDEAPVYNAGHMMGIFSVFNSDAIKDVKVIKGSAPPEYGGRLSSILDIRMKEGNMKKFTMTGGLGSLSRLTLEGPLVKDKGSFMISGRRSYADLFLKLSKDPDTRKTKLYFYDLNMKSNYHVGENDRLYISGYFGRDVFGHGKEVGLNWGNKTATIRWNHLFNDRLFLNSSLIYSTFDYAINAQDESEINSIKLSSSIRDVNLKEDFEYFLSSKSLVKFGFNGIYHTFMPGSISGDNESDHFSFSIDKKHTLEAAPYIGHEYDVSDKLKLNYGLRYSLFSHIGPGTAYTFDSDGDFDSERLYKGWKIIKSYFGPEPRFASTYKLNDKSSMKFSYARNRQHIHLLSNTASSTPFDLWHPSTNIVEPQTADQTALGYFRNFMENRYETSIEAYYKDMKHQVDYKTGANLFFNPYIESALVFGKGWSYGTEYFLRKKTGNFTGWVGYTLARTERKYARINEGRPYPSRYDRTHDFSAVGNYKLNDKWTFSMSWVFNSGDAVTFPSGKYMIDGKTVSFYTERNGYRMPSYHRLDIGVTYYKKKKKGKRKQVFYNFSLYNAYGRKNAYLIYFRENEDNPEITEAVRATLFTFYPSMTYNFTF